MRQRILTASIAGLVSLCAAPAAHATDPLAGGTTRITPGRTVSVVLVSRGVTIEQNSIPISGGAIASGHAAGLIEHSGALTFKGAQAAISVTGLRVRLGTQSTMTGLVSGVRITLLALDLRAARVVRRGLDTRITGVVGNLTRVASRALNRTFKTSRFRTGMNLGTLTITAKPASVALVRGRTRFTLDPAMGSTLQGLGIAVRPAALSLSVGGGRLNAAGSEGSVGHANRAELAFSRETTTLALTNIVVRLSKRPRLLGMLGDQRLTFANLDTTAFKPTLDGRRFTLEGIGMRLTTSAAKALNQAFGTTAFATGAPFGGLTVKTTAG